MTTLNKGDLEQLRAQLAMVEGAASKLIDRLSDRAAYATNEEYEELRNLIKVLRELGGIARKSHAQPARVGGDTPAA